MGIIVIAILAGLVGNSGGNRGKDGTSAGAGGVDADALAKRGWALWQSGDAEAAQAVIDDAVQICGGLGVMRGHPVERLYREVRALRIYEGATEVQKIVIARELLKNRPAKSALAAE